MAIRIGLCCLISSDQRVLLDLDRARMAGDGRLVLRDPRRG